MPSPRKNDSGKAEQNARRQATWRQRRAQASLEALAAKGLPLLPPLSSVPGTVRWRAQHGLALNTLQTLSTEMQSYFDDRTERWQESERGEAMLSRLELLEELIAALQELQIA